MFNQPSKIDEAAEGYIKDKLNVSNNEVESKTGKAKDNTGGLYQEQLNTSKEQLEQNAGVNIAMTGGNYGHINNRDYSNTLRLARQADRYNSRPRAHVVHQGSYKGSGIQNMGTLEERPSLNTMEQRAMGQAFQLDTNQKSLAQSLQDAVNRKDLDAFRMYYAQRYGIELSEMQAEVAMTQFARQAEMTQMLTKSYSTFSKYFNRAFDTETISALYNTAKQDNNFGMVLSTYLLGGPMPSISDYSAQTFKTEYLKSKLGDNWTAASGAQLAKYEAEADRELYKLYRHQNNYTAAQMSGIRGTFDNIKGWFSGTFGS